MIRLMTNVDMARYILPEPETVSLVKHGQVYLPRRTSDVLPVPMREQAICLPWRRSPQTSNLDRRLRDLENAVVNGFITPAEADRAFPRKTRAGGRPRAEGNKSFEAWLRKRIKDLSDPKALAQLVDEVRRLQVDKTMPRARRGARVRVLNRRIGDHDPEKIEKLKVALAAMEGVPAIDVAAVLHSQSERAAILRQKLRTIAA
jgi:hypothetical protein